MVKKAAILTVAALMVTSPVFESTAQAQRRSRGDVGGRGSMPKVGDLLPDVEAFDSNGKPFSLRLKTKGRHAVVVFGCLT